LRIVGGRETHRPLTTGEPNPETHAPVLRQSNAAEPAGAPRAASPDRVATAGTPAGSTDRSIEAGEATPTRTPSDRLAASFLAELASTATLSTRPLPLLFAPLAQAITGSADVRLSTDSRSRRALQRVGKVAATTGDIIHLQRQPTSTAADVGVVAHELTHVAHPSALPRFFDDPRPGPEEQRARTIGRLMSESPVMPLGVAAEMAPAPSSPRRASVQRVTGRGGGPQIGQQRRRRNVVGASASIGNDSNSASSAPQAGSPARSGSSSRLPAASLVNSPMASTVAATGSSVAVANQVPAQPAAEPSGEPAAKSATSVLDDLDRLVDLLEDRIIVELERRGGRFRREF
jgi:hypothetical protein